MPVQTAIEADCSFWDTVPPHFLAEDRQNPARAAAASIIAAEVANGAKTIVEVGPCLGFDYEDHLSKIPGLHYTGFEGSLACQKTLAAKHGRGIFFYKTFKDLKRKGFDIVYTKATLEHQPTFEYGLRRMILAAKHLLLINWYRPPAAEELIEYNQEIKLHFNTYKRTSVEAAIVDARCKLEVREILNSTNVLYLIRP